MNANSTLSAVVESGGDQVVAHVGLHALGAFADCLGLGTGLSERVPITGERLPTHDRGKVLVQAMLMLAGGGESCSDIEHLRSQAGLFGEVASDSTLYRVLRGIGPEVLAGLSEAVAETRAEVWRRSAATTGTSPVVLDIDASLVEIHSEHKEGTASSYKGGFGFHPMMCFADATGEALAGLLRPGNATANDISDHLVGAGRRIRPAARRHCICGHRRGRRSRVSSSRAVDGAHRLCRLQPRTFVHGCRARNVGFTCRGPPERPVLHAAILDAIEDDEARVGLRRFVKTASCVPGQR